MACLLAGLAFIVRIWGIGANLPWVHHPDEPVIVWAALRFGYGNFAASGGRPPLLMYLLFLEYAAYFVVGYLTGLFSSPSDFAYLYIQDATSFYIIGRVTVAVLGAATVIVLYLVGRRLCNSRVGLLSAAFLALSPTHVAISQVIKSDALMVLLVTATFLGAVRIWQQGRWRHYFLAGLLGGLAVAAKYNAAVVCLAVGLAHLLRARQEQRSPRQTLLNARLALVGLGLGSGFLLGYPHFVLDPGMAWTGLRHNSLDFMWGWLGFEGAPLGWVYYPFIALPVATGVLVAAMSLAGVVSALVRHKPADWLLLTAPIATYLLMGPQKVNQPRYLLPALPFLLLLAARLLDSLARRVPVSQRANNWLLAGIGLALLVQPAYTVVYNDYVLVQEDTRVQAKAWIEANIPPGSKIVLDAEGPPLAETWESWQAHHADVRRDRLAPLMQRRAEESPATYELKSIGHALGREGYREHQEASVESLAAYHAQGFEYIVTTSYPFELYTRWPGVAELYPKTMGFYEALTHEAILLVEFVPPVDDRRDRTRCDLLPIPTIRVYRIP